ncbi:alpha/beta hydrolase [Sphingomonas sp. AR_OL41]|uniref:alpha/beta hydrolase n=1 Tax=Sphingomonas sp. AR_OL41 TaxID=3042729 RepID=UPI0024802B6F|nr:alpha/beta hydrolase [Sphingomonas sp. AR_OL41]MDH7975623.1 alpha/beta hydrolase [Sphingomonas sp. AR_OL41]
MKPDIIPVERAGRGIFTRRWSPDGPPRAALMIAHGLAEHGGRYARLAAALTAIGITVYAHDHRGHGPACPPADLAFFAERDGWRACLDDIHTVAQTIRGHHPGLPLIFLGHSMGSFMGQSYIAEHGDGLAGAVLSGSAGPPPAILRVAGLLLAIERLRVGPRGHSKLIQGLMFDGLNKAFEPARTPYDWLSRDPAEVDAYAADPLCGFPLTAQLARDVAGALADLGSAKLASRVPKDLPLYIFSGERDPVGAKVQGLIDSYQAAGLTRLTTRIYPDGRHEMLNEINRDEVTRDLIAWLERVLP